jgi:hypothetical protein
MKTMDADLIEILDNKLESMRGYGLTDDEIYIINLAIHLTTTPTK